MPVQKKIGDTKYFSYSGTWHQAFYNGSTVVYMVVDQPTGAFRFAPIKVRDPSLLLGLSFGSPSFLGSVFWRNPLKLSPC